MRLETTIYKSNIRRYNGGSGHVFAPIEDCLAILDNVILHQSTCMVQDLTFCQEDFELKPPNGILPQHTFTWLGFAQYLHVTTGRPHDALAPRVVLIHRQYVVGTAADMLNIPRNYELKNIVLLDYELDEKSCGIKREQIQAGMKCPRAYMEISPLEIIPHPEFTRFGVKNSLAIVKLMQPTKSEYVLPICMPTIGERYKRRNHKTVFMIDYVSTVPTDLEGERMGKKSLKLYTQRECRRRSTKYGEAGLTQVLCTSGCGIRPGAPIITHTLEGAFELIGIGAGSALCTSKFMRRRLNKDPPVFIDVYPYVSWIINIVTAHLIPKPYPQNFRRVDGGHYGLAVSSGKYLRNKKIDKKGWKGKTFFSGKMCFMSIKKQRRHSVFFYTEKFKVNSIPPARVTVNLTSTWQGNGFYEIAIVFYDPTSTPDVIAEAGEKMLLEVYRAPCTQSEINRHRFTVFLKSCTKPKPDLSSLPPTKGSAKYHAYRVFHQVQEWLGNQLPPEIWGWKRGVDGNLEPITTLDPPAPDALLNSIF